MRLPVATSRLAARLHLTGRSARLARGTGTLALVEMAGLAVGYVSQILFARWMGPHEYGAYAYILGWVVVLAVLPTLGLPDAVVRFVPEYAARRDWPRLRGVIHASWRISLAAGAALALGGTAVVLALDLVPPSGSRPAMIIGVWVAPLLGLVSLQTALSRGLGQVAAAFAPGMLLRPLLLVLGAGCVLTAGHGLSSLTLLSTSLGILPLVLLVQRRLFRAALPSGVAQARPVYDTRRWLEVAFPLLLVTGSGVVATHTGLLVVGALAGPTEAGLYHAAARTASLMAVVLAMTNAVAAPQFSTLHAQGDRPALQALTTVMTRWGFWSSVALAFGLILLAEPLLALFGRAFVAARLVLAILAIGQLVNTGAGPVAALLSMTGHHAARLRVAAWMVAANLVLTVTGVLALGLIGAALAAAAIMVAQNVWLHRIVRKELGIDASILYALAGPGRRPR